MQEIIKKYRPISLDEMNAVSLMKRVDTKYVINYKDLLSLLAFMSSSYSILEIDGRRFMEYQSVYYDTTNHKNYFDHHNKRSNRAKVRIRTYVESELTFLEIKVKDGLGRTVKSRTQLDSFSPELSEASANFIKAKTNILKELQVALTNGFNRITLVNVEMVERVTIDVYLKFNNKPFNDQLAIIELKQGKYNVLSPIVSGLRARGIRPYSISKYCMGMASLYPELKQNYFKSKFLKIKTLTA